MVFPQLFYREPLNKKIHTHIEKLWYEVRARGIERRPHYALQSKPILTLLTGKTHKSDISNSYLI